MSQNMGTNLELITKYIKKLQNGEDDASPELLEMKKIIQDMR